MTVNWNSADYLEVQLSAVAACSPAVRHLVVDNGSSDRTEDLLAAHPNVDAIRLARNLGHGPGIDIGILHAETEFVIVLDIDAFPIDDGWAERVIEPLRQGATLAGVHVHRNYVHPSLLAMRRRDFIRLNRSFRKIGRFPEPGGVPRDLFMDVAEALSHVAVLEKGAAALSYVPTTSTRGPGMIGTVYADCVYHNWATTHGDAATRRVAAAAWREAIARYRPDHPHP